MKQFTHQVKHGAYKGKIARINPTPGLFRIHPATPITVFLLNDNGDKEQKVILQRLDLKAMKMPIEVDI